MTTHHRPGWWLQGYRYRHQHPQARQPGSHQGRQLERRHSRPTTFEICINGPSFRLGTEVGACRMRTLTARPSPTGLIPGSYDVTETDPGNMWTVVVTDHRRLYPLTAARTPLRLQHPQARQPGCHQDCQLERRHTRSHQDLRDLDQRPVLPARHRSWRLQECGL